MDVLHVDCGNCRARGPACSDCVISVLLGPMPDEVLLDEGEQAALNAMAESGLLPPLRLVRSQPSPAARIGQDSDGVAFPTALP